MNTTKNTSIFGLRPAMILLVLLLAVGTSKAGVYTVTVLTDSGDGVCNEECTLREAINAANEDFGPDTIDFDVEAGTIELSGALPDIMFELTIEGPGADRLTIRRGSGGDYRIFTVINFAAVNFSGLTISNGFANEPGTGLNGGGISNIEAGDVSISNVTLSGNAAAGYGGAVANGFGTLTVTNCLITGNSASNGGGGIYNSHTLNLTNSIVSNNSLSESGERNGGGILNEGAAEIVRSAVIENIAADFGGGIFSSGTMIVANSTISGNAALFGGGMSLRGDATFVRNSTIVDNDGGGMRRFSGTVSLMSSIVAINSGGSDLSGSFTSAGYNIVGTWEIGFVPGVTDQNASQLMIGGLENNGGDTPTHALLPGSSAVDRGNNPDLFAFDQQGFVRTYDDPFVTNASGGDGTDVGAYEMQAVPLFSDLLVALGANKTSVKQGEVLTYTITVRCFGPHYGVNTVINSMIPAGSTFRSASASQGTFTAPPNGQTGVVTWYLGAIDSGSDRTAQIQVSVIVKGKTSITNSVTVSNDVPDPNLANNTASITTSVAAGSGKK